MHQYPGLILQTSKYRIHLWSLQIYGAQTPQSEIRDSATVALELGEDWTARSDQVVTPSPPGEASQARPSGRAKAEEEVARGKVSLPLSLLVRATGVPQAEAETLGHHSDPYQVRHGCMGMILCGQLLSKKPGLGRPSPQDGEALLGPWSVSGQPCLLLPPFSLPLPFIVSG